MQPVNHQISDLLIPHHPNNNFSRKVTHLYSNLDKEFEISINLNLQAYNKIATKPLMELRKACIKGEDDTEQFKTNLLQALDAGFFEVDPTLFALILNHV